ncbi:MAG: hypothetical protein NUV69_00490 [Candidatus Curtissbacteria bacterium]|nr:hypothetical protein [Candidatus Curtissbacteria bacterium]
MAKDVFEPEVIEDNPFPGEPLVIPTSVSEGGKNDTFSPATTKGEKFPVKRTAVELLSTALNTRSRKILEEFKLVQSGAIQVGNFQEGLTGDLRITPNGITARDIAGLTTFAIDGTDGSAIFAGQVRAGSTIVSNSIITEEATSGNGRTVYLNDGIPAIVIGDPD